MFFIYKVLWLGMDDCHVTWEQEEHIPKQIVKEFEKSTMVVVNEISRHTMGQTSRILDVTSNDKAKSESKRSKKDSYN